MLSVLMTPDDDCAHEGGSPRRTVARALVFGSAVAIAWWFGATPAAADEAEVADASDTARTTEGPEFGNAVDVGGAVEGWGAAFAPSSVDGARAGTADHSADAAMALAEDTTSGAATAAVEALAPEVRPLVEPVLTAVDHVADPVEPVVEPAVAAAMQLLAPVTAPVHQVTGPVVDTVVGPLAPMVAPLDDAVDAVVDPLTAPLDDVVEPVAESAVDALTRPLVGANAPTMRALPGAPAQPLQALGEGVPSRSRWGLGSLPARGGTRALSTAPMWTAGSAEPAAPASAPRPDAGDDARSPVAPWSGSAGSSSRTGNNNDSPDRISRALASTAAITPGVTPAASAPLGARVVGASVNSGSRPAVTPD
jgi:hypothetical protein